MKYHTVLSAKAMKALDRVDRKTEQRIQTRLDELAANPIDPRISNKMETAVFRRYARVGDWRIVYEIEEDNSENFYYYHSAPQPGIPGSKEIIQGMGSVRY